MNRRTSKPAPEQAPGQLDLFGSDPAPPAVPAQRTAPSDSGETNDMDLVITIAGNASRGLYVLVAVGLGAIFLALALAVYRTREGREADRAARQLFAFSILYLFGLFATLLIERGMERLLD